ncbi:ATP-binding protein [Pantoea sp. Z09]|uniref:ATP-binding protein n=1 Tax=Pantoea sp. Z09 TaxID=2886821 RepID=UPI001EFCC148|nr:ATP-binding protein [Pantoea sp. Z09]
MESAAVRRLLLLLLCLTVLPGWAEIRPVSGLDLPMMMPVNGADAMQGKTLRVGLLEESNAPWTMRVGDELYGLDADALAALHQLTGARFTLKLFADRAQLVAALQSSQIDFALGALPNPLPAGVLHSESWFSSPLRIYRSQRNARAVMFNSQNAQLAISDVTLAQLPTAVAQKHRWRTYSNDLQALSTLLNQQNDYVVADEISASFLLSQLQQGEIYQIASDLDVGQLTLRAFARDAALIDWLNQSLRQLPAELVTNLQSRWGAPLPRYQDTQTLMLSATERQWLDANPVIYYAAESDNAPWSYRDSSGAARGYSVDLLNAIAQSSGMRFAPRWVAGPQQADALLAQHQAMLRLTQPLNGEAMQNATLPVWRALWGIYSQRDAAISRWHDLAGKRVGILRDDVAAQLLPTEVTPQVFADRASLYEALANGQIDALADNVLSARWRIAARYDDSLHLAFAASDIAWPIALGVAADQPLLRPLINRALQQIPVDTQRQMRDGWLTPPQPGNAMAMRSLPRLVLAAAGVAIVVLLVLLARRYWQQRRERLQRQQAERANAMKSQFLATVSHELRTPMQAILGLLELEKARSSNLALVYSSARSLMTLLNDLQDHARIESNSFALTPRPLALREWLAQQQRFYHPLMRAEGPTLRVDARTPLPESVLIDADRLQQVINNLMTNALKFTAHGEIRLTLAVAADRLIFAVRDSGSGIPPDEQPKLFDPWYQAPSGKKVSVQGSGLGLFICREIVQRMGGSIALRSQPGEGTEVTVSLPLQQCEAAPQESAALPRYAALRCAVVDDHPANLMVLQQQLAQFAIEADCFADGRALLRADAAQPYDLLFIDQMMPRPDGQLLLRLLRRRDRQRGKPAMRVICSADAQLLSLPLLANERVLIKPVQLGDLAALLAHVDPDPLAALDDNLRQLAQKSEKFLARLSQTLRDALNSDVARITTARAAHDWPQLAQAAHRMKGSWLLIGLEQGADLSQRLADRAKAQQDAPDEWDLLLLLTNRLLIKLDSYGSSPHS